MSSLNNPTDLLRDILLKNEKLSTDLLVQTGLDIEILERTVALINPMLDYMRGFKPIHSHLGSPALTAGNPATDGERIPALTLQLASWQIITQSRDMRLQVRMFLSRQSEWAIWLHGQSSELVIVKTPREAVELLNSLMSPSESLLQATVNINARVESIALDLAKALRDAFRQSIHQKMRDLQKEETRLNELNGLLSRF